MKIPKIFKRDPENWCNASIVMDNPRTEDTFIFRCDRQKGHRGRHCAKRKRIMVRW